MLRTARRKDAGIGQSVQQSPPAALEQLRGMLAACDTSTRGVRDRALLLLSSGVPLWAAIGICPLAAADAAHSWPLVT
ncbi:hypothetical protein [Frankia sp. Mgl5]|uniref:hypothetical protein n=1 Tax=Frankia sp. Mgl5 TaxID=2933793 RepID=UPI002010BF03|nr:hypothetical protein [Frankia sp. Mgl5]